jgi:23S rRNA-/tRNA-specific pseudouridylate synthase
MFRFILAVDSDIIQFYAFWPKNSTRKNYTVININYCHIKRFIISSIAIHRLDRLTSGILFFAKTKSKAEELVNRIKSSKVQKHYLAKVHGQFPE